jgi:hypothetical protein
VGQALSPASAGEAGEVAPLPVPVPAVHTPLEPAVLPAATEPSSARREPEVQEPVPKPIHADEVLRQKLGEIYALRSWQSRPALAMAAASSSEIVGSSAPGSPGTWLAPQPVRAETIRTNHVPGRLAPSAPAPVPPDLTELAERGFSPGLPSSPGSPSR